MFDLPPNAGPARDAAILRHVRAGSIDATWTTVTSSANGHVGTFNVFQDALKIGGIRISVSASLLQTIADLLGGSLLTPKLSDLCFMQAQTPIPPLPISPPSNSTAAMVQESKLIDANLNSKPAPHGLIAPLGKPWVLSNHTTSSKAALYGWASAAPLPNIPLYQGVTPGIKVIQPLSTAHDINYVDYAMLCVLASRACAVDGEDRDLFDVLQDPNLAPLISHEGVIGRGNLRQPGVPQVAPLAPIVAGPLEPASLVLSSLEPISQGANAVGLIATGLAMGVAGFLAGTAVLATR